jgi:protein TonB
MFDAVLDRSNVPRSRFGTGATLAVILHVGLLGLALWLSARPPPKKEKEVAVKFMLPPPPPPPPPPKGANKPKVERVERKPIRKPDTIVQPKEIPKAKPPEAEPQKEEDEGQEGGQEGGVKGGVIGGVVGGVVGGQLGGQLGSEVLPFGEGMTRPERLEGRDPQYTREALEANIAGVMLVKCVITLQGRLENCRIVKPLPHMERAVLDALSTWRYKPILYQGRPVSVDYVIPIRLVPHDQRR